MREARRTRNSHHNVIQTHTRKDRDTIPPCLAVSRDRVPTLSELVAEQVEESIVCELGLLQAEPRPGAAHPTTAAAAARAA